MIMRGMKCKKTHKSVKIILVRFGKELYLCSRDTCVTLTTEE